MRKDLPTGLYWDAKRATFYYRGPLGFKDFKTGDREQAIKAWVRFTRAIHEPAAAGAVAELIDRFVTEELPRRERLNKIATNTAAEYRRQIPILRAEFGDYSYAATSGQSLDAGVLKTLHIDRFLRSREGRRGSVSANRMIALRSSASPAGLSGA